MMMTIDLAPAAQRMAELLASVSDAQLDRPTPCPDAALGDLIDHVGALTKAFTTVARKGGDPGAPPSPSAANLETGWRRRIGRDLETLVDAWRAPGAWEGMTTIAGLELPGEVAGLIVLDELVVHGWDIAVSTDLPYEPSEPEVQVAASVVASFDAPRDGKLFGPVIPVPDDAPPLDKLLGLTGRDPGWRSPERQEPGSLDE